MFEDGGGSRPGTKENYANHAVKWKVFESDEVNATPKAMIGLHSVVESLFLFIFILTLQRHVIYRSQYHHIIKSSVFCSLKEAAVLC